MGEFLFMESALLEETQSCTKEIISKKLDDFCERIEFNYNLEIDSYDDATESFKIVNHRMQEAFSVSMEDILKQDVIDLVEALETGITTKVYAVTRIVGSKEMAN